MKNLLQNWHCGQGLRAMYVFTILCGMLIFSLELVTHVDGKTEWTTLLTATIGGLLALVGTVVNYEFGSAKERAQAHRADDSNAAPDGAPSTGPQPTPAKGTTS